VSGPAGAVAADTEAAARRYFDAVARHDLDAAAACWAPGAIDRLVPVGDLVVPSGWRPYFEEFLAAMPDFEYEVDTIVAEGDLAAVRWRAWGTFTGAPFQGIRPTGGRIEMEGIDLVVVEDGLIRRNDSYWDDSAVARQLGLLPAKGSRPERALIALFNARTRIGRLLGRR
jgi:steroid delta-isomerase-like uncharacterized protein